jgi:hypothetical protein
MLMQTLTQLTHVCQMGSQQNIQMGNIWSNQEMDVDFKAKKTETQWIEIVDNFLEKVHTALV